MSNNIDSNKEASQMNAIIIAQKYNKKHASSKPLPEQIEKLRKYCQDQGLPVVGEFCLGTQSYHKQQDKIKEIINAIAEQSGPVDVCFDRENHLIHKIFNDQEHNLFKKAIRGEIALRFILDDSGAQQDSSEAKNFMFNSKVCLNKYYSVIKAKDINQPNNEAVVNNNSEFKQEEI